MRPLNVLPIEDFLDKARIAIKGNQKSITLTIKEVTDLQNSLAVVMTRLTGIVDQTSDSPDDNSPISIKVDGGTF
jgi:hypothetical protein